MQIVFYNSMSDIECSVKRCWFLCMQTPHYYYRNKNNTKTIIIKINVHKWNPIFRFCSLFIFSMVRARAPCPTGGERSALNIAGKDGLDLSLRNHVPRTVQKQSFGSPWWRDSMASSVGISISSSKPNAFHLLLASKVAFWMGAKYLSPRWAEKKSTH